MFSFRPLNVSYKWCGTFCLCGLFEKHLIPYIVFEMVIYLGGFELLFCSYGLPSSTKVGVHDTEHVFCHLWGKMHKQLQLLSPVNIKTYQLRILQKWKLILIMLMWSYANTFQLLTFFCYDEAKTQTFLFVFSFFKFQKN